ncbi:uncharacterized protein N7483_010771 [Penicillium malachiteum]|uniref:uncharacterized protein n=1 Tax=Penicillium malachiteum TaxID=1324776 RepID=UPI002548CBB1|nr:uncharacterized protein N7483_010771 [Penicillium malachiteum]KAJ5713590.1 hypothetical protein N7483_010771 [Penicillium malachiteum]
MSATPVSVAGSKIIPVISRQIRRRRGPDILNISNIILYLFQSSHDGLPLAKVSLLLEVLGDSLLEWIRIERMSLLPSEVKRLSALETFVDPFTADIYLATGLVYGYCAMFLDVCILPNLALVFYLYRSY